MKTNGQLLYEHHYPPFIRVIPVEKRHFATADDVLIIKNPADPIPWKFLTLKSRESWETTAIGHHLFSSKATT